MEQREGGVGEELLQTNSKGLNFPTLLLHLLLDSRVITSGRFDPVLIVAFAFSDSTTKMMGACVILTTMLPTMVAKSKADLSIHSGEKKRDYFDIIAKDW